MHNVSLESITEHIRSLHDFDLSKYDPSFIEQIINKRMSACMADTQDSYIEFLVSNDHEAIMLIDSCSVLYSSFFRNPLVFTMLEQWLLPKIIAAHPAGSEIRVWSAGCAQGQEAYSAAMILSEIKTYCIKDFKYRIFATDISLEAIRSAIKGVYDNDSVRNVRHSYLEKYFTHVKGRYRLSEEIKDMVSFSYYDMLDESSGIPEQSIYGDFDIVFCSNLLIYYNNDIRKKIIWKLHESMSESSYIISDDSERSIFDKVRYLKQICPNTPIFKNTRLGA